MDATGVVDNSCSAGVSCYVERARPLKNVAGQMAFTYTEDKTKEQA
jgi:hypothetical protein